MSEKGILQLYQTDFTRYENYSTRLQGSYKLTIVDVSILHPTNGVPDTHLFNVDIQQLSHLVDTRAKLSFIYQNGAPILCSPIHFPETFINGQFRFSGLNMSPLNGLLITIEYEKC